MIRAVLMSNTWYCKEIYEIDTEELENINEFLSTGEPVLIVDSIETISYNFPDLRVEVVE